MVHFGHKAHDEAITKEGKDMISKEKLRVDTILITKSENQALIWERRMVLVGACLYQCAMIGILLNCSGVLFAQMRHELGFTMSKVSLYNTLKSVTTALAAASATALYFKSKKPVYLLLNQLITISSFLLLTVGATGPLWYVSAVLCGLSSCIGSVAVPMILTQWFPQNAGTATGIAMSFSGIGGAVCNPLCAKLIGIIGWKGAIYVLCIITLMLTIPGLVLMFQHSAPDTQMKKKEKVTSVSDSTRPMPATIFLISIILIGGSLGVTFAVNISMYAQSIGYSLTVGASMTTMIMIGNVCSKFLYGICCDKKGVWKATMGALLAASVSVLCYIFLQNQMIILFAASLIYGCVYALSVVAISRCCVTAYGEQGSKRFLGIHTCINSVVMAGSSLMVGVLFDYFQSFTPVLIIVFAAMCCSLVACAVMEKRKLHEYS